MISRRHLLSVLAASPAAAAPVDLGLGIASTRPLADPFEGKRAMIVQRSLPPLLETPLAAFDADSLAASPLTSTERFFVRWHYPFPTDIDPLAHRISVSGHVAKPLSLSLDDLARLPQTEVIAINQCAGNGRGLFAPRVPGAQWANGAMGNARWRGPRLRDVLALANPNTGALAVRASGLDLPPLEGAPAFAKSLALDHAMDGDVMLATHMNDVPLPLIHGAPIRLIVPGWYSTYWVKMLDKLEILAEPDDGYWMAKAYRAPATPHASVVPGATGFATRPVTAMVPRSVITNITPGARQPWAEHLPVRGIAMGGDTHVTAVHISADDGRSWQPATLGPDHGRHSFRRFEAALALPRGAHVLRTRTTNSRGETQAMEANWNPGGFYRGVSEAVPLELV